MGEEHFLHWLLAYEANSVGFEVTTLGRDLRDHPPTQTLEINERTAWSCWHGLNRWSNGCECTTGDTRWKPALRSAMDQLAARLNESYVVFMRELRLDPWRIREDYFRVKLGQVTEAQFLRELGQDHLPAAKARALLDLLLAQFHQQRMYVSCTFYFEDLARPEPRYGIANGLRAIRLVAGATGDDHTAAFRNDLELAVSNKDGRTGGQILDEVMGWAGTEAAAPSGGGR
jgi:hypothetical protein